MRWACESWNLLYDTTKEIHEIQQCLAGVCDFGLGRDHNSTLHCGILHCTPETLSEIFYLSNVSP